MSPAHPLIYTVHKMTFTYNTKVYSPEVTLEDQDVKTDATGNLYNYLWTYDLYGPAHKDFDAGGWKSRVLWAPVKLHEPIGECNLDCWHLNQYNLDLKS